MEPVRSRLGCTEAETGAGKDERWKKENWLDKQKGMSNVDELELKLRRMNVGKNGRQTQYQALGHATKGQSQIKHSRVCVSGSGKTTSKEQMNNEDLLKEHVSVKRLTKGPQLDASYHFSKGAGEKVGSSSEPGFGHKSRDFLHEKAQPGSRLVSSSSTSPSGISVSDYLVLLKSLHINLPKGVLNPKVIRLSQNAGIIQKAQDIVKELENFKLQFNSIPRLGCRELKNSLSLKDNGKVLEITVIIFFEKREDSEANLRVQWSKNVSNTSSGFRFRFRDKYKTMAISTPAMYSTTQTRSWRHLEVGDKLANISEGVTVNVRDIENINYCDESTLWTTSSPQRFGKYLQNPADERECLKFYHELRENGTNRTVRYTKGNKVEFGFLSGRLDFLAEVKGEKSEKMVIECKGTTGDMISKVFTKPKNGSRCAHLNETHEYCYQVQAYMYILNRVAKQTKGFTSDRAVMVIRHYHTNGQEPRDFYWNYLRKNEAIQQKIDELHAFCEEQALACFLAVLNLVFQKAT